MFVSNPVTEGTHVKELKAWLLLYDYPLQVVNIAFHNGKLQGPALKPKTKNEMLPFITTRVLSNIDGSRTVKLCNQLLNNAQDDKGIFFQNSKTVLALKQPPNLKFKKNKKWNCQMQR